jgi:hypothetical protein
VVDVVRQELGDAAAAALVASPKQGPGSSGPEEQLDASIEPGERPN